MPKWAKTFRCNLGSLNIILAGLRAGDRGGDPRVDRGERPNPYQKSCPQSSRAAAAPHAIRLGQMNLHGYLAGNASSGSDEGIDFTNIYFYTVLYHALRASNRIAIRARHALQGFRAVVRVREFFDKVHRQIWEPKTQKVRQLFADAGIRIPTQDDESAKESYSAHLQPEPQAVPPTGRFHQPFDVVDSPDRVEGRDPQGSGNRGGLRRRILDQRQPGVLRRRLRDRGFTRRSSTPGGHPACGSRAFADVVLQRHRTTAT